MDYKKVSEGLWDFRCPCGASFQVSGQKILDSQTLSCPNCDLAVPVDEAKKAVTALKEHAAALFRLRQPGKWHLQRPSSH